MKILLHMEKLDHTTIAQSALPINAKKNNARLSVMIWSVRVSAFISILICYIEKVLTWRSNVKVTSNAGSIYATKFA